MAYESKVDVFLYRYKKVLKESLNELGETAVEEIKKETPVQTGNLKDNNYHDIKDDALFVYNTVEYAPYVEQGTYKMKPNPFMRRAIINSRTKFTAILEKNLKV